MGWTTYSTGARFLPSTSSTVCMVLYRRWMWKPPTMSCHLHLRKASNKKQQVRSLGVASGNDEFYPLVLLYSFWSDFHQEFYTLMLQLTPGISLLLFLWQWVASWWLQPISKFGSSSQVGVTIKNHWNHHPGWIVPFLFYYHFWVFQSQLSCFPIGFSVTLHTSKLWHCSSRNWLRCRANSKPHEGSIIPTCSIKSAWIHPSSLHHPSSIIHQVGFFPSIIHPKLNMESVDKPLKIQEKNHRTLVSPSWLQISLIFGGMVTSKPTRLPCGLGMVHWSLPYVNLYHLISWYVSHLKMEKGQNIGKHSISAWNES